MHAYPVRTQSGARRLIQWLGAPLLIALLLLAPRARAAPSLCDAVSGNLVANCGFEGGSHASGADSGVPDGWTSNGAFDAAPAFNYAIGSIANSGGFALSIGNYDGDAAPALSQTLTDSAGTLYAGALYVDDEGCCTDSAAFFDVQVNGITVLALDATDTTGSFVAYTFGFTGTGADTLTLSGNTDPSEWYVDDVVVTAAEVPEPSSLALLAGALGAVWGRRRVGRPRSG